MEVFNLPSTYDTWTKGHHYYYYNYLSSAEQPNKSLTINSRVYMLFRIHAFHCSRVNYLSVIVYYHSLTERDFRSLCEPTCQL